MDPKRTSSPSSELSFGEVGWPGSPCSKETGGCPRSARSAQNPRGQITKRLDCAPLGLGGWRGGCAAPAVAAVGPDLGIPGRAGPLLRAHPAPLLRSVLRSLGCSRNPRGWGLPSGAGLAGGAGERAATFPEWRGDVRRKGAGRARFKRHSLSSELAAVGAGAGYISGEPGGRGADGDSSGGERLGAQRSSAPVAPRPSTGPPALPRSADPGPRGPPPPRSRFGSPARRAPGCCLPGGPGAAAAPGEPRRPTARPRRRRQRHGGRQARRADGHLLQLPGSDAALRVPGR